MIINAIRDGFGTSVSGARFAISEVSKPVVYDSCEQQSNEGGIPFPSDDF